MNSSSCWVCVTLSFLPWRQEHSSTMPSHRTRLLSWQLQRTLDTFSRYVQSQNLSSYQVFILYSYTCTSRLAVPSLLLWTCSTRAKIVKYDKLCMCNIILPFAWCDRWLLFSSLGSKTLRFSTSWTSIMSVKECRWGYSLNSVSLFNFFYNIIFFTCACVGDCAC